MVFGDHVDAAGNVLHGLVGFETGGLAYALLRLLGCHACGQLHEHMRAPAYRFFYEQGDESAERGNLLRLIIVHCQFSIDQFANNVVRVSLLVEVQHQSLQGLHGIGRSPMVMAELGAMGCPHPQLGLLALNDVCVDAFGFQPLNLCALLSQPRVAAHGLPLLLGSGLDGCIEAPCEAGECLCVVHGVVHGGC